jgi:hypothetical protein
MADPIADVYMWRQKYNRGGIYDQQDETNSQNLFLEMLYMFRAIIAHHQELGTVCAFCCSYIPPLYLTMHGPMNIKKYNVSK